MSGRVLLALLQCDEVCAISAMALLRLFRGCGLAPCAMAANLGAHLDPRENGADNARIISAMDPPHDRRRAPPLPPRTTPFSGRTRRVSALLHSSEIVTERLRPLRRQGKPTFRSDPPCKQKQTTPEDFQQLPMTIKYLPQQHEIRAIEMKHTAPFFSLFLIHGIGGSPF